MFLCGSGKYVRHLCLTDWSATYLVHLLVHPQEQWHDTHIELVMLMCQPMGRLQAVFPKLKQAWQSNCCWWYWVSRSCILLTQIQRVWPLLFWYSVVFFVFPPSYPCTKSTSTHKTDSKSETASVFSQFDSIWLSHSWNICGWWCKPKHEAYQEMNIKLS